MPNNENNLIADVLKFAQLAEMPKKADTNKVVWIKAIAKIRLANNSVAYGVLKRKADLTYNVIYINGATSSMVEVEEVYPYVVLDKERIKKFTATQKEKARIDYLKSLELPYLSNVNLEEMTLEDLNKEVVKAAVYQQLKYMEK